MPDFTIEIMQQCASTDCGSIGGYLQLDLRSERPSCTCKGYRFRKTCRHIKQAQSNICNFHQLVHGRPQIDGICPLCSHPTEYVQVAV